MKAFCAYREKRFGDAADLFHAESESFEAGPRRASILANAAAAENAMEMHRKCLKTCALALESDSRSLRAYLIKGRTLVALSKPKKARETWLAGLAAGASAEVEPWEDVEVLTMLEQELSGGRSAASTAAIPHPPPAFASTLNPTTASASAEPAASRTSTNSYSSVASPSPSPPPISSGLSPSSPHHRGNNLNDSSLASDSLRMEAVAGPVAAAAAAAAEAVAGQLGIPRGHQALAVTEPMLAAARKVLSHSCGCAQLDSAIARGYLLVNTGLYAPALALFDVLLEAFPELVAASMAKGSACAMTGDFAQAVECFTAVLRFDPCVVDGWKRRGQVQAARGDQFLRAALADLDKAKALDKSQCARQKSTANKVLTSAEVVAAATAAAGVGGAGSGRVGSGGEGGGGEGDPDILHQRGSVLHRLKEFEEAVIEFDAFVRVEPGHAIGWNYVGLCRAQLGDTALAFKAYERAIALDREFKEAWVNLAQLKRECGAGQAALAAFDEAFQLDPHHAQTSYLRGLCKHGLGKPKQALEDFLLALKLCSNFSTSTSSASSASSPSSPPPNQTALVAGRHMAGLCLQMLGRFTEADAHFDTLLRDHDSGHACFYSKEMGVYFSSKLDSTLADTGKGVSLQAWWRQRRQERNSTHSLVPVPPPSPSSPPSSPPSSSPSLSAMQCSVACVAACGWGHWSSDSEVDPYLKDAQCKRHNPHTHPLLRAYMQRQKSTASPLFVLGSDVAAFKDGGGGNLTSTSLSPSPSASLALPPPPPPPPAPAAAPPAAAAGGKPERASCLHSQSPLGLVAAWGDHLGRAVLLNECKGFLDNERQVRQFGLSVLETAQLLRKHWANLKYGGSSTSDGWCSPLGVLVPDSSSSRGTQAAAGLAASTASTAAASTAAPASAAADTAAASFVDTDGGNGGGGGIMYPLGWHPLEWRDVFDCAVRWRQCSEPNDPVWWIDRLAPEAFSEGFGLQTPLVNGQLKVIRYYPYFGQAFDLMKELMIGMMEGQAGGEEAARAVRSMTTLQEVYEAWGRGDFWVVSPCESSLTSTKGVGGGNGGGNGGGRNSDKGDSRCETNDEAAESGGVMEGTRLTVQRKEEPKGFEFTIRTPGTPARWVQYEAELKGLFGRLTTLVLEHMPTTPPLQENVFDTAAADSSPSTSSPTTTSVPSSSTSATDRSVPPGVLFSSTSFLTAIDRPIGEDPFLSEALDLVLGVFFYWCNFGPLSRGSAACGYAVLCGLLAALNLEVETPLLPEGKQLDWEAILRPSPKAFAAHVKPWVLPKLRRPSPPSSLPSPPSPSSLPSSALGQQKPPGDVLSGAPDLSLALPTFRAAVEALNATATPAQSNRTA